MASSDEQIKIDKSKITLACREVISFILDN